MSTAQQTALAEGFTALLEVAGVACVFGGKTVQGVLGQLKPDDSRLLGAPDRSALLCVLTSALTAQSIAPKRGGVVTVDGVSFTIGRRPDAQPSGIMEILIAPTA